MNMPLDNITAAIRVTGPVEGRAGEILTPEALAFVADLMSYVGGRWARS